MGKRMGSRIVSFCLLVIAIPSYTFALGPNTVDSAAIVDGQVKTADTDVLAVTTEKIADGAITTGKLAGWSVDGSKIVDYSITDTKISLNAVTTSKIEDGAVTDAKITGPISASKIQKPVNQLIVAKSGGDFDTIQGAVNYASSNPGIYLIKVMPGYYNENITISNASIYIEGSGSDTTTVISPNYSTPAISIVNSWADISGLFVGSSGRGISVI